MTTAKHRRSLWINAAAFLAAAVAHLLLTVPFLLGTAAHRPHFLPDSFGAGSSAIISSAQFPSAMTLIDISQTNAVESDNTLADIASRGVELPKSLLIASSDARPAPVEIDDAQEDSELIQAAGDTEGHAMMFGKYMGQVTARIERAWIRPRTPIGFARFDCETKIEQDKTGRVLSVELRKCNGDLRWQRSLVAAIERASPLSAPPEPSLFANTLVLTFGASEYVDGQSIDGEYEPVAQLRAVVADAAPKTVMSEPSKSLPDITQFDGNIELAISGKDTTWTLHERAEQSSGRNDNKKISAAPQ